MKRRFRLILAFYCSLFLLLSGSIRAQVYDGDLVLETQNDVDLFNYSQVTGNLTIEEVVPGGIINLNSLSKLVSVGGYFDLSNNIALNNINGLSNLISVGGRFTIYQNEVLTNLDALSSLTDIGGTLGIVDNPLLVNLDGLNSLNYIGADLNINSNASLTSIVGLSNLSWIAGGLTIGHSSVLTNLDGLSEITSIQSLFFHSLSALTDISGLSGLDSVKGQFSMDGCRNLTNLNGLSHLSYVGGNFTLWGNGFTDINGLIHLQTIVGDLNIGYNFRLPNLSGLDGVSAFDGSVRIISNDILTNIDPLSNLSGVVDLEINNNDALTFLPFDNLTSVGGNLTIIDNSVLPNLDGFSVLNTIGGDLEITGNNALVNAFGTYPHNITVGGSLRIKLNNSLGFIEGLTFLPSLGGDLEISGNASLSNIQELENIGSVGGKILISNNSVLPFISFSDLTVVGDSIHIFNNPLLTDIFISQLPSVPGNFTIQNNATLVGIDATNLSSIGRFLNVISNNNLANLNQLANLTTVGGLNIGGNIHLTNISALSHLTTVPDSLIIENNPALPNLNGLLNIQSVGEDLSITNNDAISNLDGLSHLNSVGGNLYILNNNALSEFCRLNLLISGNGLAGHYNVSGNAVNPTKQQIIDSGPCCIDIKTNFYRDADGDGFGNPSLTTLACTTPTGYVSNSSDCDDTKSSVHTGAIDICNSMDDDCDGQVDEDCSRSIKVNVYGGLNPYSNPEWNNWNTSASLSSANLLYSDGTVSTVRAVISQQTGISDNGIPYNTTMAPPEVNRYASYSTANRTLTISGLDNTKTYNLEIYATRKGVSNNTTRFIIGATVINILTDNNLANKASFNSLTPSSGSIQISLEKLNSYNYINGFILSTVGLPVPPPPPPPPPPSPPPSTGVVKVNVFGGVNPYNNPEWNNWNSSSSLSSGILKYSDGTVSLINASLSQQSGISDNGIPYITTVAPSEVMRYASYSTSNRILIISGLDNSKKYNLALYASRKGVTNNTTRFTIGSVSRDVVTDNNLSNEVAFSSLVPSSGQIIVNISRLNEFNYLSGFILSENTPPTIPETLSEITEVKTIKPSLNIFPNPIKDRIVLKVESEYKGKIKLEIINMSGMIEKQINLVKNQESITENIQLDYLKTGNYIIRIQGGKWTEYKMVSKL